MINFGFETNDRKLESPLSPVIDHLQEDRRMKTSDYYPIVTETCTICISGINSWAQGIQIAGLGHGPYVRYRSRLLDNEGTAEIKGACANQKNERVLVHYIGKQRYLQTSHNLGLCVRVGETLKPVSKDTMHSDATLKHNALPN